MPDLFLSGLLIGAIVGAPVGPIGTAVLIETIGGNLRGAIAGMSGCFVAEVLLIGVAVLGAGEAGAFLTSLPRIVPITAGAIVVAIGLYYVAAASMPRFGDVTTFLVAFKITAFTPHNLAALVTFILTMNLAPRLNSPAAAAVFVSGELLGVLLGWIGLLLVGWRLRRSPKVHTAIPWLRRSVGIIMVLFGTILLTEQIFAA